MKDLLNIYETSLIKLEVLKFIIILDDNNINQLLYEKNINIKPNIIFFFNLNNYNINNEIKILNNNKTNKIFNYINIKDNKILKYILKKNENKFIHKYLYNICKIYNFILNNVIINIKIDYNNIIRLYKIIYEKPYDFIEKINLKLYYESNNIYFIGTKLDIKKKRKELKDKINKDIILFNTLTTNLNEFYNFNT